MKNIYVRIADLPQFEHEDLTKLRSLLIEDEENEYENELKIYKVRSKMLKIKNYFKRWLFVIVFLFCYNVLENREEGSGFV